MYNVSPLWWGAPPACAPAAGVCLLVGRRRIFQVPELQESLRIELKCCISRRVCCIMGITAGMYGRARHREPLEESLRFSVLETQTWSVFEKKKIIHWQWANNSLHRDKSTTQSSASLNLLSVQSVLKPDGRRCIILQAEFLEEASAAANVYDYCQTINLNSMIRLKIPVKKEKLYKPFFFSSFYFWL